MARLLVDLGWPLNMESETDLSGREHHLPNLHFSGFHVIHVEIFEGCTVDDVAATIYKGNFSRSSVQSISVRQCLVEYVVAMNMSSSHRCLASWIHDLLWMWIWAYLKIGLPQTLDRSSSHSLGMHLFLGFGCFWYIHPHCQYDSHPCFTFSTNHSSKALRLHFHPHNHCLRRQLVRALCRVSIEPAACLFSSKR